MGIVRRAPGGGDPDGRSTRWMDGWMDCKCHPRVELETRYGWVQQPGLVADGDVVGYSCTVHTWNESGIAVLICRLGCE